VCLPGVNVGHTKACSARLAQRRPAPPCLAQQASGHSRCRHHPPAAGRRHRVLPATTSSRQPAAQRRSRWSAVGPDSPGAAGGSSSRLVLPGQGATQPPLIDAVMVVAVSSHVRLVVPGGAGGEAEGRPRLTGQSAQWPRQPAGSWAARQWR